MSILAETAYNEDEYKQYSCINLTIPALSATTLLRENYDKTTTTTWSPESLHTWKEMSDTEEGCLALLQNQASLPVIVSSTIAVNLLSMKLHLLCTIVPNPLIIQRYEFTNTRSFVVYVMFIVLMFCMC
jgi:hypothetical protein